MPASVVTSPELFSMGVELVPVAETVLARSHGYQTHGLFFSLLKASSPALAEEIHDLDGPKPFTVSPLMTAAGASRDGLRISTGNRCRWRLAFLRHDVFAHFLDGLMKWGDRPLALGPAQFRIGSVNTGARSTDGPGFTSYAALLENAFLDRHIGLEFNTPTVFRSGGKRNVLFPEPALVFGSLFSRWQAFSPVRLTEDLPRYLEAVLLARYILRTEMLDFGAYQEAGFTGHCQYEVDNAVPEDAVKAINALADFASYCGTGAKTTMGMGQTRRWSNARTVPGGAGRHPEEASRHPAGYQRRP